VAAAKTIRSVCQADTYCIVVEHDLSVLDYLSDTVCCLYGVPGAYGVVTMPFSVREGINIYLSGFIPTENLRFREEELKFKIAETIEKQKTAKRTGRHAWPLMIKQFEGKFKLTIDAGDF
jgi:ATP-binding cassette subfamily E protein 1